MKYLKGLASSNEDDAHHYFQNLDSHLVPIVFKDDADDEIVDKWFRKNRADDRKVLLSRPLKNAELAAINKVLGLLHNGLR